MFQNGQTGTPGDADIAKNAKGCYFLRVSIPFFAQLVCFLGFYQPG